VLQHPCRVDPQHSARPIVSVTVSDRWGGRFAVVVGLDQPSVVDPSRLLYDRPAKVASAEQASVTTGNEREGPAMALSDQIGDPAPIAQAGMPKTSPKGEPAQAADWLQQLKGPSLSSATATGCTSSVACSARQ
jgi:hypothetical protein